MSCVLALFLLVSDDFFDEPWFQRCVRRSPHGAHCVPCQPLPKAYPPEGRWACWSDGKTYSPADVSRVCEARDGGAP